jgi:dipeptidyl aminopeptidase/acylaminoacyl peptidase
VYSPDAFRYDTRTGKKTILTNDNPGNSFEYLIHKNVARVAVGTAKNEVFVRVRDDERSPWREVARWNAQSAEVPMIPIRFDEDGTLFVASNDGRDTMAIYKWDWPNNKLGERIAAHGRYDLQGGLIFDDAKKRLVGLFANMDRPQTVWFDPEWAQLQATVDRAIPNRINTLTREGGDRILVTSFSDRDPATWYLYDPKSKRLEELVSAFPWLRNAALSEAKFIQFDARDGLRIPAYLTLPQGKPAKDLPLVVNIHGGPFVRGEAYGYDRESQFLASRGYAVLQIDFRGSEGYGKKHATSGWKQWGQTMQTDITDGAMHLVKEGIVDKNRMCLMGGSYGGYATMQGLVNEPDLWKCGINIVGVTDLVELQTEMTSDVNRFYEDAEQFYNTKIGNRKDPKEREMLERFSPVRHAEKIKAPVLIAHGLGDERVPISHANQMRAALRKHGKEPEWVVYNDEGHGFLKEANNFDFYSRVEKFLAKHIGK